MDDHLHIRCVEDGDEGKEDPVEDKPAEAPPKRRRHRAAQDRLVKNTAIPAPEIITLRRTPKTPKPLSSQHPNRMIGRMGKLTPTIGLGRRTRRIVITYRSPKRT